MRAFIRATSCISAQETFNGQLFSSELKEYGNNFLNVIEPGYKATIDAKYMRRMSKVVRIGVASALACLSEADATNVDAIITGTAYGCMEDSEAFLKAITLQDEEALSPTPFIQSTHNTVGAQIALMLKCHQYNNTFVHRGFSFEYALIDSLLFLEERKANFILAGGVDEMTDFSFSVLKKFGLYKQSAVSNFQLYNSNSKGSIAGEGAAFFLLSNEHAENDYAVLDAIEIFYKPVDETAIKKRIEQFLSANEVSMNDIDLIITGKNGDVRNDTIYANVQNDIFKNNAVINYKHLCGEYPTSVSFALWLAANIISKNKLPESFENEPAGIKQFKRILIYNNYLNMYHSLMLLSSCIE